MFKKNKTRKKRQKPKNLGNLQVIGKKAQSLKDQNQYSLEPTEPVRPKISPKEEGRIEEEKLRMKNFLSSLSFKTDNDTKYAADNNSYVASLEEFVSFLDSRIAQLLESNYHWAATECLLESLFLLNEKLNYTFDSVSHFYLKIVFELLNIILEFEDSSFFESLCEFILTSLHRFMLPDTDTDLDPILINYIMSKAEKDQIIADAKLHFMDSMAEIYKSKLKDNFTAHTEFYLGECLGYRIPYMQNQGASDKEIEAYYNKNADYPGLFQNYTSYLAETEQYDKLFKTIQENDYRKNEFSLFNMYFNQNEYYQVIFDNINSIVYLDNIQDYFKELFEIFIQECRLDHTVLEILLLFREYAPPQKFEEFIEYIYNSKKIDMLRKAYIAAAYQDYDRLADFVLDSKSSPELFDLYYDKLYKRFPDRVQDRYAELLQNTPSFAKNRPEYRHIINHLEAITNDFPNGKETAQMIGQNWRRDFKRKRALHDELSKAGF